MSKKSFTCGLCGKHHLKSRTCAEEREISLMKVGEEESAMLFQMHRTQIKMLGDMVLELLKRVETLENK